MAFKEKKALFSMQLFFSALKTAYGRKAATGVF
jgi:hypothetical protein